MSDIQRGDEREETRDREHRIRRPQRGQSELAERSGVAQPCLPSTTGYAAWRVNAIKEIQRLCEESIDHDTGWAMFKKLVISRLETEEALMPHND